MLDLCLCDKLFTLFNCKRFPGNCQGMDGKKKSVSRLTLISENAKIKQLVFGNNKLIDKENGMSVKFHNFGGALGWNLQKRFPKLSSESYLKLQFLTRNKLQEKYIEYFYKNGEPPMPLVVNLETINRCNSTCSFCTANKNAEKRPYKRMEESLFYSIIDQLADWGYKGHLTLYGNNEPCLLYTSRCV